LLKNYYKILGVADDCTAEEIKKAYRRMALMYHPDLNSNQEATQYFMDITEAYKVLSNETRRKNYDYLLKYVVLLVHRNGHPRKYSGISRPRPVKPVIRKPDPRRFQVETLMFYALLVLGIISIILSVWDLFSGKYEGARNFSGISFGVTFTGLLVYGWYEFLKTHN
jgi:curved DNA-binding protein CbpA